MNEATLEARVNAEIQKHFPSIAPLRITHQKYLTLRLGHRTDIEIDGLKQAKTTGRLDILLSFDEKPLAILELKAPGKPLTDDDRGQGLSYAKLSTPQAPLVIVSNGEEAQFFQTHDGKEWNPSSKDDEAFRAIFSHALSCAADERNEAIQLLLGKQPHVWTSLFRNYFYCLTLLKIYKSFVRLTFQGNSPHGKAERWSDDLRYKNKKSLKKLILSHRFSMVC